MPARNKTNGCGTRFLEWFAWPVPVLLAGCIGSFDESDFRLPDAGDGDVDGDVLPDVEPDADGDAGEVEGDAGGCSPPCVDDGDSCNGREICLDGECLTTRPPDDGTECTNALGADGYCFDERCRPLTCGNGVTNSGEDCDDGNLVDDDGCESDCTFSCRLAAECDDEEPCNGVEDCLDHTCTPGTPPADGTTCGDGLVCRNRRCVPGGCGDAVVDPTTGEACDDGNDVSGDGCENDCTWSCERDSDCDDSMFCNGEETCVDHVCVGGYAAADGTPCLRAGFGGICRGAVCAPMTCGDETMDAPGEACDDGNLYPGDGCENDCTFTCVTDADCSDVLACNGEEACETSLHVCFGGTPPVDGTECNRDGDPESREICLAGACRCSTCGDGFLDQGADEACDDGNMVPGDGCENDCRFSCTVGADCDDGEACNGTETCDPTTHRCVPGSYRVDGASCTTPGGGVGECRSGACVPRTCGNGTRDPGEECDDGNAISGDGCEVTCRFSCRTSTDCREVPDDPCTTDTCETVTGGQRCSRANNSGPCDDRDACTSGDVCNATTGACAGTRIDTDGDTYGPGLCGGDCNDANRDVHPFAPEICNGIDDDCNGLTDDGPGMTCRPGSTRTCEATGSGGILCAGTQTCNGTTCTWNTTCALGAAEICNGADDDCDGTVDEGFTCARGSSRTCTATGAGGATCPGTQACLNDCSGYGACVATAVEVCNGLDDDCDTLTDETFSCVRGATSACTRTGAGGRTCSGTRTCGTTCAWGECMVTTAETCNALDDDCDTLVDEDFPCTPGQVGSCTVGGCAGTRTCSASCAWGACTATAAEVCNGLDDDCDTLTDEGFTCALGATQTCTTSCSSTGSRTCVSGCVWGTCVPPAEACNGIDDDCDTVIDNGFPCVRNATGVACTNTCGAAGMTDCSATCTLGTCCVPTEICGNGCDDDCDTLTDEGCAAVGTPCSGDGDCGGGGGGLICNENWGICVVADCTGQPNFQPCETITTPDRSYDICSGGTCVSPGCGTAACNAPGPGFPLADTNQRTCHDNSTALASCPGGTPPGAACDTTAFCGQDAQYGWDTRNPASARFTRTVPVADQPVVLDNVTGLEWQGCTAGMTGDASSCTGTESTRIWTGALAYCDGLTWGGYSDWRLPDNFELLSIVDRGVISDPPIDGSAFPGTPAGGNALWSSSSDAAAPYKARYVAFFNGGLTASAEKTYGYSVRCVRRRPSTVPNPRFARREPLSGEFVVDDAATGLVWQGCAAGRAGEACSGTASRMNWQTALDHCQDSTWAGFSDWHLPSAIELQSILENSRFFPAIDATSFPGTPTDYFLSSSSNARNPIQMWAADFNGGLLGPFLVKSQTFYVRCVRAGP